MNRLKFFGKTYRELAIIGAIILVFVQFTPTVYNGATEIFGWGIKYNEINASINAHNGQISTNSKRIDTIERDVKGWRAVWCIAELSNKKSSIPQAVQNACQEWIKNP